MPGEFRDPARRVPHPRPAPVAVVVPARVETAADLAGLRACLDALAAQTRPAAEVVVVDDGSPRPIGVPGPARVVRVPAGGSYAARNAGIAATDAPVVAFTDADCRPTPTWLADALAALDREPDAAAVAGAIEVPVTPRDGAVAWHDALTAFPQESFVARFGFGATANLVVRRAALEATGGFDGALRSGGDAEWGARAAAAGHRTVYRGDVRVLHPPRRSARAVARKALRVTRGVEALAAARGDADPLPRTLADRLSRPWRELPAVLADERVGPLRAAQVTAVGTALSLLVAAETTRLRLQEGHLPATSWREGGLPATAVAGVAAVAVVRALRGRGSPDAFGDGAAYRRMARGLPGAPPFQRRVVGPALARLLGGDERAFRRVALAGVAGGAVTTGLLTARVAREAGADAATARRAAWTAAALVPAMPHSTRMAVLVPPFGDQLAVAAGGLWLLLDRARHPLAPVALAGAGLTREQWLGVAAVAGRRRPVDALAAALAAAVIATRERGPDGEVYPPGVALRRFVTRRGLAELGWACATLAPFPALVPGGARTPTRTALLRIAAVQTALGLVGGSDSPRLLHGGLPFLVAATLGSVPAQRAAPAVAAALALWRPLHRPEPTAAGYERSYLPYMHGELGRRVLGGLVRTGAAYALDRVLRRVGDRR